MKLQELPPHARPREKLRDRGLSSLSESELLAILLRTGYQGKSALEIGQRILKRYSLAELAQLSFAELTLIKGIGPSRAAGIQATFELGRLLAQDEQVPTLSNPTAVWQLAQPLINKKQEHLLCLYLDARHHLICQETITIGTINSSLIHPREVFAPALQHRASNVIIVHNHPSGDTNPSEEDIRATEILVEAGQLLDIPILDHVIVSAQGWLSFRQQQLL